LAAFAVTAIVASGIAKGLTDWWSHRTETPGAVLSPDPIPPSLRPDEPRPSGPPPLLQAESQGDPRTETPGDVVQPPEVEWMPASVPDWRDLITQSKQRKPNPYQCNLDKRLADAIDAWRAGNRDALTYHGRFDDRDKRYGAHGDEYEVTSIARDADLSKSDKDRYRVVIFPGVADGKSIEVIRYTVTHRYDQLIDSHKK
jgi:hypothetical protein